MSLPTFRVQGTHCYADVWFNKNRRQGYPIAFKLSHEVWQPHQLPFLRVLLVEIEKAIQQHATQHNTPNQKTR